MILERYTKTSSYFGRITTTPMIRIRESLNTWGKTYYYPRGYRGSILLSIFNNLNWDIEKYTSITNVNDDELFNAIMWLLEKRGRSGFNGFEVHKLKECSNDEILNFLAPHILADKLLN